MVQVAHCFLLLSQYYYFIRLMGRKASHVALECTLQSHPNMVSFLLYDANMILYMFQQWNQYLLHCLLGRRGMITSNNT